MISCSLSAPGKDGKRVVNKQFSFADYHKSNDIWFPYHLIEKTLGQDGSVQSTNVMTVKEVKLNPRFDTDAFDYTPTFGSRVQDQRDHLEYRVGMEQPTSKPSS
jgi:hypothetical protein